MSDFQKVINEILDNKDLVKSIIGEGGIPPRVKVIGYLGSDGKIYEMVVNKDGIKKETN